MNNGILVIYLAQKSIFTLSLLPIGIYCTGCKKEKSVSPLSLFFLGGEGLAEAMIKECFVAWVRGTELGRAPNTLSFHQMCLAAALMEEKKNLLNEDIYLRGRNREDDNLNMIKGWKKL